MRELNFCFEKKGIKVYRLHVLGESFYVITKDGRRYIRKSLAGMGISGRMG